MFRVRLQLATCSTVH